MNKDALNKTQEEKKLDTLEVVSAEQSIKLIDDKTTTDPEKEDLIVNNLALYFVSLARSMSKTPTVGKSS